MQQLKNFLKFSIQIFILWIIYFVSNKFVHFFNLPIPGSVLGMIVLFILLLTGVIKEHWLSSAINPLLQHLTFFFIPFAVELMQWGDFFIHKGIILFLPLVLSAFVGIAATGGIVQLLNKHSMDKK